MKLLLLLSLILKTTAIWLPEYKVNLKQEEEFVISETLEKSDVQDIYDEEEAIRQEDLKTLKLYENDKRYFGLHRMANLRNAGLKRKEENLYFKRVDEFNPDMEESRPWIGGFVDKYNNIMKNEDTLYFDDEAKNEKIIKREAENDPDDYNYANLKAQYDDSVKKAKQKNDTAKYKEVKEEESAAEAVKTLVDFKAKNCTEEEKSGLGVKAIKCFWLESKKKHMNKDQKFFMLKKVILIMIIWILIYACIAIPLWCQYGEELKLNRKSCSIYPSIYLSSH
ncbi:unnamed protein product [Ceutorhynchus assimilis]|uniref:Uncharacterized protein n=1 Tax=Ceutorhynchus assimilis TaxID=467358 RepID=A0A9N9QDY6_9CUCU|nr:unnamed protein product [Ceutorhynchus assimilis]